MKIVTLNTWGGRAGKEGLLAFFETYKDSVDVFCLQEIWAAPYDDYEGGYAGGVPITHGTVQTEGLQEISAVLTEHVPYFRPHFLESYGLLMLVRNTLRVVDEGELFVHREKGYVPEGDVGHHARNIQYVTIEMEQGRRTIINFHGLWNGKGKDDSEDRLEQSQKIITFCEELDHPYVLCGDFNLNPETKSIKLFEVAGMRNLVSEYGITSTRTSFYEKPGRYADYVFTAPGIHVHEFAVLPDEVSDHAALTVDIQ